MIITYVAVASGHLLRCRVNNRQTYGGRWVYLGAPSEDGLSVVVSVLPALRADPRRRLRQAARLRGCEIHGKRLLEAPGKTGIDTRQSEVCEDVGDVAVAGVVQDEIVRGLEDELRVCVRGYGCGYGQAGMECRGEIVRLTAAQRS